MLRPSTDLIVAVMPTDLGSVPSFEATLKSGHHQQQADRKSKSLTFLCMCFASAEINGLTWS